MFLSHAALAIAVLAPLSAQAPTVRTINLYSYGYQPNPIVLTAGRPVTLTFVNRAGKGHNFTAEKFFRASKLIRGNVPQGEIELRPGQSASVTLVPRAGRYRVFCGHPLHNVLGMHASIVVK